MINYKDIVATVNKVIKGETGNYAVPQNTTEQQPKYPFTTYTITSPYIAGRGAVEGDTVTESVEIVLSLTFVSDDRFQPPSMAQQVASSFKHPKIQTQLREQGVIFVRNDGFGNRDTFITIETEFRHGFDLRLRVQNTTIKESESIENIEIEM